MVHSTEPRHRSRGILDQPANAFKWAIGYDDNEINRLGVPVVSSRDWLRDIFNNPGSKAAAYFDSLFPFRRWITSYNTTWLIGDIIAGVTVALVLVPQSMSYASLAGLAPEFGLYSSFVGVMIYALFATSKDVTIGPVAVMSLQTSNVIQHVRSHSTAWAPEVIATALAFLCGVVCLGVGLLRIGFLVEFIPTPAVAGFMTGSAIQIAAGQVPKLLGLSSVQTNSNPAYRVIIDTLKALPMTNINAAFGLPALAFLFFIKWFTSWLPRRYPRTARAAFFIAVLRNAFVIIVLTIASRVWLGPYRHGKNPKFPISILKTVPRGFKHLGQPNLDTQLLSDLAPSLPVSVIILLLEHIAIAKSFGRLNNYKINPNQELIAIGVTNLVGPCFGAYAATGSFSRTAIKSKSGARSPLAGWFTGILVLIAIYALTGVFYWIPNAVLSAVIIHAVTDLVVPFSVSYKFWLINPLELIIFLGAVFATIFSSTETGVYVSVAASLALLLIRIARPRGRWLGVVRVSHGSVSPSDSSVTVAHRDVFVPLDDKDGLRDPSIHVQEPPPGVLIYRFEEAFTYPNCSHLADLILDRVKEATRPGRPDATKLGDRPWNNPGGPNPHIVKAFRTVTFRGRKTSTEDELVGNPATDRRPILRALIFDFSSVSNVDTTSIQTLVDVRTAVERYADAKVEFHFANILSPWIRRGLLAGGFGLGFPSKRITEIAPVVSQRENITLSAQELEEREQAERDRRAKAIERALSHKSATEGPAYPFSGRPGKHLSELEAGLAGDGAAASQSQIDLTVNQYDDPDRIVPTTKIVRHGVATTIEDGVYYDGKKASDSSTSDTLEKDMEEGSMTPPGRPSATASQVSIPIIWGSDLTPFFHLDLSAAFAAATEGLGEDSRSSSLQKD